MRGESNITIFELPPIEQVMLDLRNGGLKLPYISPPISELYPLSFFKKLILDLAVSCAEFPWRAIILV